MEQLHPRDPHHIGPYLLLSRLGGGDDVGRLYLARSDRDGRTVAVRLVHQELAAREGFRTRLRQEFAAARHIGGAWTAPVLDADIDAETPWFATGYVAGPSLRHVVARDFGPLPPSSMRVLAAGLAYALHDIHRAGLVHRDLNPSNILLTLDGPRVIAFGTARPAAVTAEGFIAPEQLRGEPVTPARDVFGLGAVLAYAATGRLPSGGEAEPDLDGVPAELRGLVRDCLRRDPTARPEPAEVLARVGADAAVADGKALGPWLPEALVAQLGRHAVRLLDREDAGPDRPQPPVRIPVPASTPAEAEAPTRPRRRTASTVLLLAVAAAVAALSGATVYTVMSAPAARLPEEYIGTWQATTGARTWQLTLIPGAIGDPVMTLAVEDPGFTCAWTAPLRAAPDPVELAVPSLTSGAAPACAPDGRSRLRMLPDGTLQRELAGSGNPPLDYRRH